MGQIKMVRKEIIHTFPSIDIKDDLLAVSSRSLSMPDLKKTKCSCERFLNQKQMYFIIVNTPVVWINNSNNDYFKKIQNIAFSIPEPC